VRTCPAAPSHRAFLTLPSKVHFLLVNTLNSAFSGYDFSALRPDHLTREISAAQVLSHLSSNLLAIDGLDLSP
jgi:hypothetical protein